jgi:hypothetical protein
MKMCELVRRPITLGRRRILPMTDKRETDFLAYILAGFVIAIGGIAVGVASTNIASNGDARPDGIAAVKPAAVAAPAASQSGDRHRRPGSQEQFL